MAEQLGDKRVPWEFNQSQDTSRDRKVMDRVNNEIRRDLKRSLVENPSRMLIRRVFDNIATLLGGPAHVDHVSDESLLVAKKTLQDKRK